MNMTRIMLPATLLVAVPLLVASPAGAESMRDSDMSPSDYDLDFTLPDGVDIFADVAVGAYLARDERGEKIERTSVKSDGQIGFAIDRTIYNGLRVLGNATWNLDLDPESYLVGVGGGIGEIFLGSNPSIAERLHISIPGFVPHKAVSIDSADIYPSSNDSAQRSTYIEPETLVLSLGNDHILEGNAREDGNDLDPNMITYISSELSGFVVGFSYIPDLDNVGQASQDIALAEEEGSSSVSAATILSARYEGKPFGPEAPLVSGSFGYVDAESSVVGLQPQAVSAALQVKAGDTSLGASYFESRDLARLDRDENRVWIVGISQDLGDITIGAAFRKSRSEYDFDNDDNAALIYDDVTYRGHNEAVQFGLVYHTGSRYSYGVDLRHIRDRNNLTSATAGDVTTITSGGNRRWKKSYSAAFVLSIAY